MREVVEVSNGRGNISTEPTVIKIPKIEPNHDFITLSSSFQSTMSLKNTYNSFRYGKHPISAGMVPPISGLCDRSLKKLYENLNTVTKYLITFY